MPKKILGSLTAFGFTATIALSPVWGQSEQTTRVVGTVDRVDGANLVIKTAQSEKVVNLAPNATVFTLVKATLADVKAGAFIGVGATPNPTTASRQSSSDLPGIHARPGRRGSAVGPAGHHDDQCHGRYSGYERRRASSDGQVQGGREKDRHSPWRQHLDLRGGRKGELKPGASVTVTGVVSSGGAVEARRVVVGRGGVVPS